MNLKCKKSYKSTYMKNICLLLGLLMVSGALGAVVRGIMGHSWEQINRNLLPIEMEMNTVYTYLVVEVQQVLIIAIIIII